MEVPHIYQVDEYGDMSLVNQRHKAYLIRRLLLHEFKHEAVFLIEALFCHRNVLPVKNCETPNTQLFTIPSHGKALFL